MKRIQVLDSFRGLAALGVVLFHYSKYTQNIIHYPMNWFEYGYTGVFFFFMVSGFVIFLTVRRSHNAGNFLFRRFSRLYPTFWFCLLLTSIITRVFTLPGRDVSWLDTLANITMIPKCFGFKEVDGAYWSLLPEFFFYLLMYLVLVTRKINKIYQWILPWLMLCFFKHLFPSVPGIISTGLSLNYGCFFISGIMFYLLKFDDKAGIKYHIIIALCLLNYFLFAKSLNEAILVSCFFIIFYLFIYDKLEFMNKRAFTFLGTISFPLYLLHQNIGYVVINMIKHFDPLFSPIWLILPITISVLLATFVHKKIEEPTIKWFRSFFDSKKEKITEEGQAKPVLKVKY